MKRILICKSFTLVRHKQAKNYGAFARLITLASFLFPDPELGLCMQTRLLLGVPCAFVFEQSSSVFVALNVFASISLMPPKKILRLDSSQRTLSTFFNTLQLEEDHSQLLKCRMVDSNLLSLFCSGGHTTFQKP